jgi:putative ABC transport system substrate-binding protein
MRFDQLKRRELIALLGGAAAAWPLAARAQQPARYRIGHLAIAAPTDTPPPPPANWDAFVQGLREAGYVEGRNIAFEHRSAHDQPELFPKLASELASINVDAIFARGTWALAAAKNATRTIPIVGIDLEIDPVEALRPELAIGVFGPLEMRTGRARRPTGRLCAPRTGPSPCGQLAE